MKDENSSKKKKKETKKAKDSLFTEERKEIL